MSFRNFLERLEERGALRIVKEEVDPKFQIADFMSEKQTPTLFESVKDSDYRVGAGICSSRENIAQYLNLPIHELLSSIANSIENPTKPKIISKGACQEVEEGEVDLNKIPIETHYKDDDGAYITSGITIAKDPEYGGNLSFHRLKRIGKKRLTGRICERHTHEYWQRNPDLEVAICIGNTPSVLLGAATSVDISIDEIDIACALEKKPIELVKCKTIDVEVPADCEIVLEGRFTNETAKEGKFVDMTGTYDIVRGQPVIEITHITHRENPIYQSLLPGGFEHRLLMGMPREPTIFNAVNKVCECSNVNLTPGGCSWLHAVVGVNKKNADDGKKAIEAAFDGHKSLKQCIIVDNDIDIFNGDDVEWALATRFQAHKDLVLKEKQKGSSLDPSAEEDSSSDRRLTTKMGLDATVPWDRNKEEFRRIV